VKLPVIYKRNMEQITLNAYAKINLSLVVTGKRPDGYHDIRSLMQGIGLCDVIKITKCPENGTKYNLPHCTIGGIDVYLCTDVETIPMDMSNLALRGIAAVLDACGSGRDGSGTGTAAEGCCGVCDSIPALVVDIEKKLPVAAGIAGGSGNAAACMLGMNALLGSPMSLRELMEAGAGVGADVPFSLMMNARRNDGTLAGLRGLEEASTAAWIGGIGDIVEPAEPRLYYAVMANPGISVSTRAAYEAIDAIVEAQGRETDEYPLFVNDLESYTLRDYPEAARLKTVMQEQLDADIVMMSGSGPTMIAYYGDRSSAEKGFARMQELCGSEPRWRTWLTVTGE
jgi:4-diphosphocytidyl-2-C-methyl-D-erythritol kinase